MKRWLFFSLLMATLLSSSWAAAHAWAEDAAPDAAALLKKAQSDAGDALIKGDSAWMLISSALVMLMIPGLALFYCGMVRRKNVLGTMMHSMVALAIVGVYWVAIGYALAFGNSIIGEPGSGILGWNSKLLFLQGIKPNDTLPGTNIPVYLHMLFQGMFAIITPALISGALAERIRFKPYCLFTLLWVTLVYCPLAHMVWAMNWWDGSPEAGSKMVGLLGAMGALDFAGGTVVHIAAGVSSLAAILVLPKRLGYPELAVRPNSMVLTLIGAGLLWFGWFGFNGGSAVQSGFLATSAFAATQAAAAAAGLSWMLAEWFHRGKPTALGLASGIVAGLVAVTPASGFVYPWGGLVIGLIAGVICYISVSLKPLLGYDDSLDAFGVHGVGGFLGAVLTGFFCYTWTYIEPNVGADGLLASGGDLKQVIIQLKAALLTVVLAFLGSIILVKLIDLVMGFATDQRSEIEGLDRTEHGETGFDLDLETETVPVNYRAEPRHADMPPNGHKRFSVIVEGAASDKLIEAWSSLCQPNSTPPSAEFQTVYPHLTTVQGNRFRFRSGNQTTMRDNLQRLLQARIKAPLQTHVEA